MGVRRQIVAEETVYPAVAVLTRRQADAVHDDEAELATGRPLVVVRRLDAAHAHDPSRLGIDDHAGSSNLLKFAAGMGARL
jgi:hypothetical protein